jgi:hypothetical protein
MNKTDIADILKPYVDSNDSWYNYFNSFIPKISISWNKSDQKEAIKDVTLEAIKTFLASINEKYAELEYDSEFIANFIGVITAHGDNKQVLDIISPMTDYFEDVIHAEFLSYQHTYDTSSFCAVIPEYGYV